MNQERKRKEENRRMTMMLIPFVAALGKFVQFFILPDKYFYDSWRMNLMMQGETKQGWWSGYEDTINIFSKIDFFHFNSSKQWSIALGIVFTIALIIMLSRVKEMTMMESLYTLMAVGLLNIYVFNLAKEPIQMSFFFMIMIVIMLPINNFVKMIGCALVYYWESTTFREYYIMMAAMTFALFFVFDWLRGRKRTKVWHIILAVIACFIAMFLFMYLSQYVDHEGYAEALKVRDQYANEDAVSVIKNPYEVNGNYGTFMIDYVVCAVRMMIPIELVAKSPVYAPFFIYQIFVLVYFFRALKNIRKLNKNIMLALTCFTAYLFGSFVFEPDFGSWVRHEAATFPLFHLLAYEYLGREKDLSNDKVMENETKII